MSEFVHIFDRAAIHFFSACSLVLLVFFALWALYRRIRPVWLPEEWKPLLLLSALTVFSFSTLREAWDVAHGQPLLKAFTDYTSWFLGTSVSCWGLYRFKKL